MKAKLTFVMLAMMMLFAATPAHSVNIFNYVTGTVTDQDGVGIDAEVNASCNDTAVHGIETTMNDNGDYFISLPVICTVGSKVCVTATADETGYVNTVCSTMLKHGTIVNVGFIDIISTPEFGLIAIPLLLSMAGFVFMKGRMM